MEYRRMGGSGLRLSELSLGFWITYGSQVGEDTAVDCMKAAYDAGMNFFDNAEAYGRGAAETVMGSALRKLGWPRHSYVVSTKFYWGIQGGPNHKNTLNRKYLVEAMHDSLKRLQLDYVDLVYCHRPDPNTPVEETVRTMHDFIQQGKALYWGTSEWPALRVREAWDVADRHHLHKPVVEQPQYNMFAREQVERGLKTLYGDIGLGLTTWSPLASGSLSGKYLDGVPEGSRLSNPNLSWLKEEALAEPRMRQVRSLKALADELGCTLAQFALAWCLRNPDVSSVITGASRVEQVHENLKAAEVRTRLTSEMLERVDEILGNRPDAA